MSLWKVPDLVTTNIMKNFYESLSRGLPKDDALRDAQSRFLRENTDPLYSHPYFWSGFVVIGDTAPLQTSRPYMIYLIAGLFVVGIGILIFKSRK
jgi:hypothetical protein